MRNKRSLLSFGLFALVLVLGVGYAIVSTTELTISGQVTANSNVKVSFQSATPGSDKVTANASDGSITATIGVENLASVGETVTATYKVQNKETDVNATVEKTSVTVLSTDGNNTDLSEYFEVTTSIDDAALELAAEQSDDIIVTVKLLKTPLTDATSTANVTIKFTASADVQ